MVPPVSFFVSERLEKDIKDNHADLLCRYHDAQAKCPLANGNGYVDFVYNGTSPINTDSCYGYFQCTYTSDAGMTNISHLPLDYLVDYAGNLNTVS